MTLAIDGSVQSAYLTSGATAVLPGLTTSNPNDVICVAAFASHQTIASVTSPHLTFTRRASVSVPYAADLWVANAASPLAGEVITVTFSGASPYGSGAIAFGVSGGNPAAPWDTNGSLPATKNYYGGGAAVNVSTTSAVAMILGAYRAGGSAAAGSGFTQIGLITGGHNFLAEYKLVAVAQSSLAVGLTGTVWSGIGDALVPAGAAPPVRRGAMLLL